MVLAHQKDSAALCEREAEDRQIPRAFDELRENIACLSEAITSLLSAISPVIKAELPSPAKEVSRVNNQKCVIAEIITDNAELIKDMDSEIRSALERIQL